MTKRQKDFVKSFVQTENATNAALRAGYSPKTAHVQGCRLLKNDKIQQAIAVTLDRMGLDDEMLSNRLKRIIEKGVKSERVAATDALRGIEMAFRLKDRFPAMKHEIDERSVKLSLEGKSIEELNMKYKEVLEEVHRFKEIEGETDDKE